MFISGEIIPADFFGEHPPERLVSAETEYDMQCQASINELFEDRVMKAAGLRERICDYTTHQTKMYVDLQHAEIAPPPGNGPEEAAALDRIGISMLQAVVQAANYQHDGVYRAAGVFSKTGPITNGRHENYVFPRSLVEDELLEKVIASHIASRVPAWGGTVGPNGYGLSQKSNGISTKKQPLDYAHGAARTIEGSKPLAAVIESDDTVYNSKWSRLEIRHADPLFSWRGQVLAFAATSLVLRIVEHQSRLDIARLGDACFEGPGLAARRFSDDITLKVCQRTKGGSKITALNFQEELVEAALQLSEKIELPKSEQRALQLWQEVLGRLAVLDLVEQEYAGLDAYLDVAVRYKYLRRAVEDKDIRSNNPQAFARNLMYDLVQPSNDPSLRQPKAGIGIRYWDKVDGENALRLQLIDRLTNNPPCNRAAIMDSHLQCGASKVESASWSGLKLKSKRIKIDGKEIEVKGEWKMFYDPYYGYVSPEDVDDADY